MRSLSVFGRPTANELLKGTMQTKISSMPGRAGGAYGSDTNMFSELPSTPDGEYDDRPVGDLLGVPKAEGEVSVGKGLDAGMAGQTCSQRPREAGWSSGQESEGKIGQASIRSEPMGDGISGQTIASPRPEAARLELTSHCQVP